MTQLNTPYPSTAYLTGFLRSRGVDAVQADVALALVLRLLSPAGLAQVRTQAQKQVDAAIPLNASVLHFLAHYDDYANTIAPVIAFLQGRDATLMHRIASLRYLPEGPRFAALDQYAAMDGANPELESEPELDALQWAFGALGTHERARHIATLYLNDLADVVQGAVDARFAFVRYGEQLAASQASFAPLAQALAAAPTLVDSLLAEITLNVVKTQAPQLVLLSLPFPGTVYGALRMAQAMKTQHPTLPIALGGGFVNTELRSLNAPELFDYVDYVCLDAGERPVLSLIEHLQGQRSQARLQRTFVRTEASATSAAQVRYIHWPEPDIPFEAVGTPTWDGLPLGDYLSLLDMLNPMHRLWSDGRWNKLTVAQGCYWKKCSFCDISLDYIGRYETASATLLVDRIASIIAETGQTGFHFVDEAAPPKMLKALALELLRRKITITWWGNIRFEKTFTPELARLLADSGCIAMSGGLEVASDRLLTLMQKGVSVAQVARVTQGFAAAGIMVHAYLMYGFPTQTVADTVDALETVRQLFVHGCIHSGFFHRFTCTAHSPVGMNPAQYGIRLLPGEPVQFAHNDVAFVDPSGVDHDALGLALKKAIYNYMHGVGLDTDVRAWFEPHLPRGYGPCPKPRVGKRAIARALQDAA